MIDGFIGMFAFVLVDRQLQKAYVVRDRAGVKPLFYYWKNNCMLFGSELKSFHEHPSFEKNIDPSAVADLCNTETFREQKVFLRIRTNSLPDIGCP